jgi:pyruvate formate lyase activating enzyme
MMKNNTKGRVHSFQSLGTLDGPGVRFVVFLSGCNLRCGCCHNPDTWEIGAGTEYTAEDILRRVVRYREYYGREGGITVSGGEPLLQADFVRELFTLCKQNGVNTCLDTSGSIINDSALALLDVCDRVLLDIKYTNDADYKNYVGCSIEKPLRFLDILSERNIPTTVRQVTIPTLNDNEDNMLLLKEIVKAHPNVDKIELLPFRKICQVKYDNLGIRFPFGHLPEPTKEKMAELNSIITK